MKKRIITRGLSLIFSLIMIVMAFPFSILTVSAATTMDENHVYKDLQTFGMDLSPYKKNTEDTQAKLMQFFEFCYDANGNQNDYGLYLYVYNPSCEPIKTLSQYNTIQIGLKDFNGNVVVPQAKYKLVFLSHSTSADGTDCEYLYYKFKVDGIKQYVSKLSSEKRVYDVVDLELMYGEEINPRKTNLSNSYQCRGYMPNHDFTGKNEKSTYYCFAETLETIQIELGQSTWKTATSDKGENYQYEVFSVYFAIPDYYLDKYGDMSDPNFKGLYAVRGEYYEFKINGLVTDSVSFYETAKDYVGHSMSYNTIGKPYENNGHIYSAAADDVPFSFWEDKSFLDLNWKIEPLDFSYNVVNTSNILRKKITALHNCFNYDLYSFGNMSSEKLLDLTLKQSPDGFYSYKYTENGEERGRRDYEVKVDDSDLRGKIASYASNHDDFITWLSGNGHLNADKGGYAPIEPIKMISSKDVSSFYAPEAIARNLFISEGDVAALEGYVREAEADKKTTYLMRFAVRDYYFSKAMAGYCSSEKSGNIAGNHYYFEKTIFHNFDVLEFTFKNSKGEYTKVPVSTRPISIVGNITPIDPDDVNTQSGLGKAIEKISDLAGWFKILILVVGLLLILAVISWFGAPLEVLFRGLGKIIAAPFKLIGKGIDYSIQRSDKRAEKRRKNEDEARKERDESRKESANERASRDDQRRQERHEAWKKSEKTRVKKEKEKSSERKKDKEILKKTFPEVYDKKEK